MENATYASLSRQSGLMSQMRVVANNIANASTTGYRAEGVVFSEYVAALGPGFESVSMGRAAGRVTDLVQGGMTATGGTFDLAIEGDGFFMVQTPEGERLTRAGHFMPNAQGDLVTADGYPVLGPGGAPVFVPQGVASLGISADGTLSADGQPVGEIGVVRPIDPQAMIREHGVMFRADEGVEPAFEARVLQGFLEESNVNPIEQITRMIEVQRAYELGQSFLDKEDSRIRAALQSMTR
ncbi:flagellar hook-basal body complex protein [Roseisalinus antarcticus]|uniref:Flagellar basal-body rod protein FlgF n=1 Tax=Roseisalinus antarcticus TaxID=254357 RepID=A0A1Y5TFY0_9RHOB|nr:flagellar hook-basal body complex protein [Roseisalinus antarcticus]SLN62831.1 Flagellar basal-body rod protein FlgF [Roseisalinus antarcticus]